MVLKDKKLYHEKKLIEYLRNETETKLQDFIKSKMEWFVAQKFDDADTVFKYIIIKQTINILKQILEETLDELSPTDVALFDEITEEVKDPFKK